MPDTKLAETLLRMASKDLRALEGMQGPPFDDEVFGFHAQQCLEKALKAWLCLTPTPFPRTHDLDALVRLLDSSGQSVPEHLRPLVHLSDFAVEYRYAEMPLGPLDRRCHGPCSGASPVGLRLGPCRGRRARAPRGRLTDAHSDSDRPVP